MDFSLPGVMKTKYFMHWPRPTIYQIQPEMSWLMWADYNQLMLSTEVVHNDAI